MPTPPGDRPPRGPNAALDAARVSRAEALAHHLERTIVDESLEPGDRIATKTELRDRFGVAFATINEALAMMELRGLVDARPGRGGGVFVASVSDRARASRMILGLEWGQTTLHDVVEVRATLEPQVYRQATAWAGPEDFERLHACVERMAGHTDDVDAFLEANWAYHRETAAIGHNAPLRSMYLTVLDILEAEFIDRDFEFDPAWYDLEAALVHRDLTEAIAAGGGPALDAAIHAHAIKSPLPE